jgi:hypothetical protein
MKFAKKTIISHIRIRQLAELLLAKRGIGDKILPHSYEKEKRRKERSLRGQVASQPRLRKQSMIGM